MHVDRGYWTKILLDNFPHGTVLGGAKAKVGELGITIQWVNRDGAYGIHRYENGEMVDIIEVKENSIMIKFGIADIWLPVDRFDAIVISNPRAL